MRHRWSPFPLRLPSVALAIVATIPLNGHAQVDDHSSGVAPSHFAVASISRNTNPSAIGRFQCTPDGLVATASSLQVLIKAAYRLREYQLSGGPSWLTSDLYDVQAKVDDADLDAFKRGGRNVCLSMLQNLLSERFHLAVHHKTSPLPAYELVIAKGGPKMPLASPSADPNDIRAIDGMIDGKACTMSFLARALSGDVGLPVTDKTNLSGTYNVALHWTPHGPNGVISSAGDMEDPNDATGSIFSALQEQLGLQLRSINEPTDVIVVDHIERVVGN